MGTLWQDIRYGFRLLLKRPGFTVVAVITLALGIGANTAIFSVVNSVLLRPLPYPEPERLVTIRSNQSVLNLVDIQAQSQSFEDGGGAVLQPLDYTGGSEPLQVEAALFAGGFFKVLGGQAALGRVISPEEDRFDAERVVVLSHGFWQQLGGDPNILGRTIPLSGQNYTVVGVMPPGFVLPQGTADVFASVRVVNPLAAKFRGVHFLRTYWRLKPGVQITQAQAEMQAIDQRLAEQNPAENKSRRSVLFALHERIVGETRPALLILFGAVGLVLLIACANFANLLLARSASRQREIVIRTALGAGRGRLIRQLLTESVLLSVVGGAVGLIFAVWLIDLLISLKPENLPQLNTIGLDRWVLLFTLGISVLTGLVFGLMPAWKGSQANINEALKEGGRSGTAGAGRKRLSSLLVVSELALAVVLLIGAGLLIKAFWQLRSVEPGFKTDGVLSMRIELPETRYKEIPLQTQFRRRVLEAVNSQPGVEAAMVSEVPLSGEYLFHDFIIEGRPPIAPGEEPQLFSRSIGGDYFRTMGIPLKKGRSFTAQDDEGAPLVGVVNESMVKQYFQNEDPVGARIRWARSDGEPKWITIVGVVGDIKHFGLDLPEEPAVYWPYEQSMQPWKRWMSLVVRSRDVAGESASNALAESVKKQVWTVDPQIPVTKVRTMTEVMASSVAKQKFNMLLLGVFAAVALLLASVGIYGVINYTVTQRTHEIGIRMALGARASDVLKMILRQGLMLTLIGVAIGVAASLALTRVMASLLFGVSATDPATFAVVSLLLACVALVACYIPARRATKVDPMIALRYE
jgi:putative ABC transport system permease protein